VNHQILFPSTILEMLEGLDDAYFIDAVGASGAGMTDHLFHNNTKYLLIDEIMTIFVGKTFPEESTAIMCGLPEEPN
jgi:hypothetical protein